jgi:hypothetical protein
VVSQHRPHLLLLLWQQRPPPWLLQQQRSHAWRLLLPKRPHVLLHHLQLLLRCVELLDQRI